ncbi:hypothetical protein OS493_010592 [Desmophyllum pertusum]|uniref:Uncharacterized protein n=1 Tax=Desmophyllum pertusum TaxID=174260 RepID=A0A9W9ZUG8_9CNID|nr:hypothetical protein OS493_010592 [Desmophyllum pertusum]
MLGWKVGWYTAVVRCYNRPLDEITIEYSSEEGNRYVLSVKESVSRGSLKLLKATCDSDLYDEETEIGAVFPPFSFTVGYSPTWICNRERFSVVLISDVIWCHLRPG